MATSTDESIMKEISKENGQPAVATNVPKTAKQLKNEAKKQAKMEKFAKKKLEQEGEKKKLQQQGQV